MERRKFLTGLGAGTLGTTVLVSAGAFDRTASQRRVKIEVTQDPQAYLGLDECPAGDSELVFVDDDGHLEVNLSTEGTGGGPVPASTVTHYDDVFEVCNYGKDDTIIWLRSVDRAGLDPDHDGPVVTFYVLDEDGERKRISAETEAEAIEEEWFVPLPVGECLCVGIRTDTRGLENVQLLEDDEVVINARTDTDLDE